MDEWLAGQRKNQSTKPLSFEILFNIQFANSFSIEILFNRKFENSLSFENLFVNYGRFCKNPSRSITIFSFCFQKASRTIRILLVCFWLSRCSHGQCSDPICGFCIQKTLYSVNVAVLDNYKLATVD